MLYMALLSNKVLMKTTVTVDDALYLRALELADPMMDRAELFSEALTSSSGSRLQKTWQRQGELLPK